MTEPIKKELLDKLPPKLKAIIEEEIRLGNDPRVVDRVKQELIDQFSPKLKEIIDREIKRGNVIVETSKGWPKEGTIFIFLKKPFTQSYNIPGVGYRYVNDPHWWKAEYTDKDNDHILACRF